MSEPKVEYTIIIKKTEKDVPFRNREYKLLKNGKDGEDEKYGYTYFDDVQDVTSDVFEQTVDDLEVQAVIRAVNNL